QVGNLDRSGRVAHGRQQHADADVTARLADVDAFDHGFDDLVGSEAPLEVQLGREPNFGVDDAVGRQVLNAFSRHPAQRVRGLHHGHRVLEGAQVKVEAATGLGPGKPSG